MQTPDSTMLKAALDVARNPENYTDIPAATFTAWATLKAARGQELRPDTLPRVIHATGAPCADLVTRIHARRRQIMAAPTGGDAA